MASAGPAASVAGVHCLSTLPAAAARALPCAAVFALFLAPAAAAWVDPSTGAVFPTHVTRRAEIPERNWQPGHRGVDLALRPGGAVLAAGGGTVAFAGTVAGVPVVSIDHPGGLRTTYQPVHASVRVGDAVDEGQPIGTLARTASAASASAGDHDGLHWGARTGPDAYIDPLSLLKPPQIRLKPLDGEVTRAGAPGRTRP